MRFPTSRMAAWAAALGLAATSAACAPQVKAPADRGVCWHMVMQKSGPPKYFSLGSNVPDLEHCAAALEAMRLRFLSLGGSVHEVQGAYQGQFLFDDQRGVFTSAQFDGMPFPFLVRTGDGRLVPPGAPQD
jgi:hypothetical protein